MQLNFVMRQARSRRVIKEGKVETQDTLMGIIRAMSKLVMMADQFSEIMLMDPSDVLLWSIIINNQYGKWSFKEKSPLERIELSDDSIAFEAKTLIDINPATNTNIYYQYEIDDKKGKVSKSRIDEISVPTITKDYLLPIHYMIGIKNGYRKTEAKLNENGSSVYRVRCVDVERLFTDEVEEVRVTLNVLNSLSRQITSEQYNISLIDVSDAMIQQAEGLIGKLSSIKSIEEFNKGLIRLFTIIPRKMNNVKDYLAEDEGDIETIINQERELLDNLKVQKDMNDSEAERMTFIEKFGFDLTVADDETISHVKDKLDEHERKLVKQVFCVNSPWQDKRFKDYCKENSITNIKQLWHGSRNENWLSILKYGLKLNPNAVITGKMFGDGIYFAPESNKSFNYTSLHGTYWAKGTSNFAYMALYDVAYGNPYYVKNSGMPSDYDHSTYNCLHALKGTNLMRDEIVFYKEEAMVPRYLVLFAV